MDQITPDPYKGFKAGSNFNGKFRNCTTMDVRTTPPDYILKLSSFNEITRDSKESFCPVKAIIKTKGAGGEERTKTLKFPNKVREHRVEGRFNLRLQPRPSSGFFGGAQLSYDFSEDCKSFPIQENQNLTLSGW